MSCIMSFYKVKNNNNKKSLTRNPVLVCVCVWSFQPGIESKVGGKVLLNGIMGNGRTYCELCEGTEVKLNLSMVQF